MQAFLPFPPTEMSCINPINFPRSFASIDMGTNSFKLTLILADQSGRFLSVDRIKESVVLGRGIINESISFEAENRSVAVLKLFSDILERNHVKDASIVATSAVREAKNRSEFVKRIEEELGFKVDVLEGKEEARLIYLGILQFCAVYDKVTLTIDIGGGSTEFIIGKQGKTIFASSIKLGHVTLTDEFVRNGEIVNMRNYIRSVLMSSDLVEKVREDGFEVVIGSSGTIKSIEKAISFGFAVEKMNYDVSLGEYSRDLKFNRDELRAVVDKLYTSHEKWPFSRRRSEFILAGSILLLEIFEVLDIFEMEVSCYALGEGIIAETLSRNSPVYDVNKNSRWRSIVSLASRFNSEKKMKNALHCGNMAREILEGLKACDNVKDCHDAFIQQLEGKDAEYLEAAILLHTIGLIIGKKGYHRQSYHIIKNNKHLHGYSLEEIEMIALLVRYHRKKFPRNDHSSLEHFSTKTRHKLRALCAIMRISLTLQRCSCISPEIAKILPSDEGFKLVLQQRKYQSQAPDHCDTTWTDIAPDLEIELKHFKEVFGRELSVVLPSI